MDIASYQRRARETDQIPKTADYDSVIVPLLGIAGEIGTLQAAYKKKLRDGDQYDRFPSDVAEELGDIIWYVSNLADCFNIDLSEVLNENLHKTQARWPTSTSGKCTDDDLFDSTAPVDQRLPRTFTIEFRPLTCSDDRERKVQAYWNNERWGDELGDNSYVEDGYRFHDVMHLAHASVLGWSPVARRAFGRKREYSSDIDGVEDGGRAIVVEEGIVAYVYGLARQANYFANNSGIDWATLKTIRNMTAGLEVQTRPEWQWERAIMLGYEAWRQLREREAGIIEGDLYSRSLTFVPSS